MPSWFLPVRVCIRLIVEGAHNQRAVVKVGTDLTALSSFHGRVQGVDVCQGLLWNGMGVCTIQGTQQGSFVMEGKDESTLASFASDSSGELTAVASTLPETW